LIAKQVNVEIETYGSIETIEPTKRAGKMTPEPQIKDLGSGQANQN